VTTDVTYVLLRGLVAINFVQKLKGTDFPENYCDES